MAAILSEQEDTSNDSAAPTTEVQKSTAIIAALLCFAFGLSIGCASFWKTSLMAPAMIITKATATEVATGVITSSSNSAAASGSGATKPHTAAMPASSSSPFHLLSLDSLFQCYNDGGWLWDSAMEIYAPFRFDCNKPLWNPSAADNWRYQWHTASQCELPYKRFDAHHFCRLLDGRQLLLVGDSLQHELHDALLVLLHSASPNLTAEALQTPLMTCDQWSCVSHIICDGVERDSSSSSSSRSLSTTIRFVRNDRLSLDDNLISRDSGFYELPWLHFMQQQHTLLMINRGAHYEIDDVFITAVNATLHYIHDHYGSSDSSSSNSSSVEVLWRTTPAGHENCMNFHHPLTAAPDVQTLPYHWDTFHHQNALVRELLSSQPQLQLNTHIVDVQPQTAMRADSHESSEDCLHYISPGVPETAWATLTYNVMAALQHNRDAAAAAAARAAAATAISRMP